MAEGSMALGGGVMEGIILLPALRFPGRSAA
jgi:hypothetical protein